MLSRIIVLRRAPRIFVTPTRLYSDSRSEGSVSNIQAFADKQKAHENKYIHDHELAQLKKLLEETKEKAKELQDEHDALVQKKADQE